MNQTYDTLKQLLRELGVKVPNSVIRKLLATPMGNSLRGVSDALDSLSIENCVYHLPEEYISELEYPYIMGVSENDNSFVIVTNDAVRQHALKAWNGIVLTAKKTGSTSIYKYVTLRNVADNIVNQHLLFIPIILIGAFAIFEQPAVGYICHAVLSLIGMYVSVMLLRREHLGESSLHKYCKLGDFIDCEYVLNSKGSSIGGIIRLSDLSFLFFVTQLALILLHIPNWQTSSLMLLSVGCALTLYSMFYQFMIIRKVCLFCMLINLIVWLDTILLASYSISFGIPNPYGVICAGLVSYFMWRICVTYYKNIKIRQISQNRLSSIYSKDIFDLLLSCERKFDDIDDKYTECYGIPNAADTITFVVHPKCNNCKKIYSVAAELKNKTKVRLISLAKQCPEIQAYCERNKIDRIPTVIFNHNEMPHLYDVEDLKYII